MSLARTHSDPALMTLGSIITVNIMQPYVMTLNKRHCYDLLFRQKSEVLADLVHISNEPIYISSPTHSSGY